MTHATSGLNERKTPASFNINRQPLWWQQQGWIPIFGQPSLLPPGKKDEPFVDVVIHCLMSVTVPMLQYSSPWPTSVATVMGVRTCQNWWWKWCCLMEATCACPTIFKVEIYCCSPAKHNSMPIKCNLPQQWHEADMLETQYTPKYQ